MRRLLALVPLAALASASAHANGPAGDPQVGDPAPDVHVGDARDTRVRDSMRADVPWGKRRVTLGFGAGASISSSLTVVAPSLRTGYFVVDGLELGLEVDLGVLLWSAADFTAHPGLARGVPNLALRISPTVRYVFLRQPGFSPYLLAGVGPTWWNHVGGGDSIVGHWTASPGALIYLGGRVYLDLAIRFSGTFPGRNCHRAFTVAGADVPGYCGFQFGPRLGFVLAF